MSEVEETAKAEGLYVATWSPGDGVTRYRFFEKPSDYHSGDSIYTALGRKEALTFITGYSWGVGRESRMAKKLTKRLENELGRSAR